MVAFRVWLSAYKSVEYMFTRLSNVTDMRTDRQTEGRTTVSVALCTSSRGKKRIRPLASLLITGGGVVFLRFWTFSGFENWSFQWLSRRNLDF